MGTGNTTGATARGTSGVEISSSWFFPFTNTALTSSDETLPASAITSDQFILLAGSLPAPEAPAVKKAGIPEWAAAAILLVAGLKRLLNNSTQDSVTGKISYWALRTAFSNESFRQEIRQIASEQFPDGTAPKNSPDPLAAQRFLGKLAGETTRYSVAARQILSDIGARNSDAGTNARYHLSEVAAKAGVAGVQSVDMLGCIAGDGGESGLQAAQLIGAMTLNKNEAAAIAGKKLAIIAQLDSPAGSYARNKLAENIAIGDSAAAGLALEGLTQTARFVTPAGKETRQFLARTAKGIEALAEIAIEGGVSGEDTIKILGSTGMGEGDLAEAARTHLKKLAEPSSGAARPIIYNAMDTLAFVGRKNTTAGADARVFLKSQLVSLQNNGDHAVEASFIILRSGDLVAQIDMIDSLFKIFETAPYQQRQAAEAMIMKAAANITEPHAAGHLAQLLFDLDARTSGASLGRPTPAKNAIKAIAATDGIAGEKMSRFLEIAATDASQENVISEYLYTLAKTEGPIGQRHLNILRRVAMQTGNAKAAENATTFLGYIAESSDPVGLQAIEILRDVGQQQSGCGYIAIEILEKLTTGRFRTDGGRESFRALVTIAAGGEGRAAESAAYSLVAMSATGQPPSQDPLPDSTIHRDAADTVTRMAAAGNGAALDALTYSIDREHSEVARQILMEVARTTTNQDILKSCFETLFEASLRKLESDPSLVELGKDPGSVGTAARTFLTDAYWSGYKRGEQSPFHTDQDSPLRLAWTHAGDILRLIAADDSSAGQETRNYLGQTEGINPMSAGMRLFLLSRSPATTFDAAMDIVFKVAGAIFATERQTSSATIERLAQLTTELPEARAVAKFLAQLISETASPTTDIAMIGSLLRSAGIEDVTVKGENRLETWTGVQDLLGGKLEATRLEASTAIPGSVDLAERAIEIDKLRRAMETAEKIRVFAERVEAGKPKL